jgi:hypothetical protein
MSVVVERIRFNDRLKLATSVTVDSEDQLLNAFVSCCQKVVGGPEVKRIHQ